MELRNLVAADRAPLESVLRACEVFSPGEVEVALELLDIGLQRGDADSYRFVVAEVEGRAVGYACWGHTPLADGVFDLYWIAVHPAHQGRRLGGALLEAVEAAVRREHGRLLLVETDSKPQYEPTRRFYLSHGYGEAARIRDFYRPGDDKIVYEKRF